VAAFLLCNHGLLGYKSLCAAVTICATMVNIQIDRHTDRQHFDQLIRIAQPAGLKIMLTT